jgi:putative component of toxin-antitoxin plasmid stabilization module
MGADVVKIREQEGSELIILFGGGTKKNQQKDVEEGLALLQEYKALRKGE